METTYQKLCQIGFTKNEALVYLELLKIGPQPVSTIAKRTNMNRTTAYSVLEALFKKGTVSSYKNDKLTVYSANDPNTLIGFLDRQCRTFDYYKNEMLNEIPHMRELSGNYNFRKPIVRYLEGVEGVKQVMYDALEAKESFCAYLCLDKWFSLGLEDFLLEYKDLRILNKQVQLKAIAADTERVRDFFAKNYDFKDGMTNILLLDKEKYEGMFDDEINVYDDKISILHLDKGEEYGVIIESQEIARKQRAIFEIVYEGCKILS